MPGSWEEIQDFEPPDHDPPKIEAVHLIHLPNGKFLAFQTLVNCRLWTPPPITAPGRGTFEDKPATHNDFFCAGHCALANGKVFVAGGNWDPQTGFASKKADVFDTFAGAWDPSPYPPRYRRRRHRPRCSGEILPDQSCRTYHRGCGDSRNSRSRSGPG